MAPTLQPISPPPTNTPIMDSQTGLLSDVWMLWFTDLFNAQKSQNGGISTNAGAASAAQAAAEAAQAQIPITVGQETARAEAAEDALGTAIAAETTRAEAAEALLAPQANPTFSGTVTEPNAVLTGATPAVAAGQLGLGASTAATATAGAGTLPATPVGFLVFNLAGTVVKVPYYAA
jgi:hypothetical protein